MDMQKIIDRAEGNIRQALKDYAAHTMQMDVLQDISDPFITRLARDSSYAKQELRELFSKSPVWREDLDALVINGTRTHDPDYNRIYSLASRILQPAIANGVDPYDIETVASSFATPNLTSATQEWRIAAINRLAPKAYVPGKKLSRVFKALCVKLGVSDESAGSEFQHLYAQFADELTTRKIDFKLFVSINPAHFLTMSNPKNDDRGMCLTSCHSLNSTHYSFNNGCAGYARDECSFIVFTVDDPTNLETLNNRKTTRQIFAYKPGNGLLLQSRMYNTAGGVYGAAEDSKLYRDLVQREISMLEGAPNLWKTGQFYREHEDCVEIGYGFGGYTDWTYEDFDAHISIRHDHTHDYKPLVIGTYGLCVCCGAEIGSGMYCEDCKNGGKQLCEHCNEYFSQSDLYEVQDEHGDTIHVCEDCRDNHYTYCGECEQYHPAEEMEKVYRASGVDMLVCEDCLDEFELCPHCDYRVERREDGTCPVCGAVFHEEETEVESA